MARVTARYSALRYLHGIVNIFRIRVNCQTFFLRMTSPIDPNTNPKVIRARYGRLAKRPECAKLNPSTVFKNFGAAVMRK